MKLAGLHGLWSATKSVAGGDGLGWLQSCRKLLGDITFPHACKQQTSCKIRVTDACVCLSSKRHDATSYANLPSNRGIVCNRDCNSKFHSALL